MALISPEYRELQMRLHEGGKYGNGIHSLWCNEVIRELAPVGSSVLDYGSGSKSHMRRWLGDDYDVREYDPCVPGKDGKPEPADVVICADVLEHIEPENLDTVLAHLSECSRKWCVAVISTRPAEKNLPDGRNAHLIVEKGEWWRQKLSPFFRIERLDEQKEELYILMETAVKLPSSIKSIGVMSDDERNEYVKQNVGKTWKRIPDCPQPPNNKVLIVACYGPSLGETYKNLIAQRAAGKKNGMEVEVVSVSGAHDFLRAKGIKPDWHVECDPRLHKSEMIAAPKKGIKYLMASCCHPDLIGRLSEYDLILWHLFNGESSYKIRDIPSEKKAAMIPGGGSVGLRTLTLFYFLGYRSFIIHGFDCSFSEDGRTHAGPHSGKKLNEIKVRVDGTDRWFRTAPVLASYAQHMLKDIQEGRYPRCQFWFEGDGLFQLMLKQYLEAPKVAPHEGYGRDYFTLRDEDVRPEEGVLHKENAA